MRKLLIALTVFTILLILLPTTLYAENWQYPKGLEFLGKLPPMMADTCAEKATGVQYFCIILLDIRDGSQYLTVWNEDKTLHEVIPSMTILLTQNVCVKLCSVTCYPRNNRRYRNN